jgi:hypothetical protein
MQHGHPDFEKFYGSAVRDWATAMTSGDGGNMTAEAMNFIAMKEAARLVKAADRKAAKSKEEDDAADSPDPFEIGSVCYHGKGLNRRHVTVLEITSRKPLKYRISGKASDKQSRFSLHTDLEFSLTAAEYKEELARNEAARVAKAAHREAEEKARQKAREERQAKAEAKATAKRERDEAKAEGKRKQDEEKAAMARKTLKPELSPPPPPPPNRSTELPQGWKAATDATTGEKYYYNRQLGLSQYELPHSDPSPPPPPPPRRQSLAFGAGSSGEGLSSTLGGHSIRDGSSHGSLAFASQFLAFQQQQHIAKLQAELQFLEKAEDKARVAGELAVLRMHGGFAFTPPQ